MRATEQNHTRGSQPPAGAPYVALCLCAGALVVSVYLVTIHFAGRSVLACPTDAFLNCETVLTSSQSLFFARIPVALPAAAYFAVMAILCSPKAWRSPTRTLRWARLGGATLGTGFVLYFAYNELVVLDALCVYCTAVHLLTVALAATVLFGEAAARSDE